MRAKTAILLALLGCGLCLLSSCVNLGEGTTETTRLYALTPMTGSGTTAPSRADGDIILGIGPLTMPAYLKRPQIVTRVADNEMKITAFANWVEPLDSNIQWVLAENLSRLLGTDAVHLHPWRRALLPTYRLLVEVIRFDASTTGDAILSIRWELLDARGEPVAPKQKGVYRQAVAQNDIPEVVTAMSMVLADFSREVAEFVKTLR